MKRILPVDDDETFKNALAELLRKLKANSVDLICSDYNMRGGTGLDLLRSCEESHISLPPNI